MVFYLVLYVGVLLYNCYAFDVLLRLEIGYWSHVARNFVAL